MTDKKRQFTKCQETCAGGRACVCCGGHKAGHICMVPDCVCHAPESYGLALEGAVYRSVLDVFGGVAVLRVRV